MGAAGRGGRTNGAGGVVVVAGMAGGIVTGTMAGLCQKQTFLPWIARIRPQNPWRRHHPPIPPSAYRFDADEAHACPIAPELNHRTWFCYQTQNEKFFQGKCSSG